MTSQLPSVSVVIATLGRPEMLREQLEALQAQDYEGDLEVVVARNGPEDGTGAVVSEFATAMRPVRLIDASQQRGISFARNQAVAAARGDVIACCDDDDRAEPGWVSALVVALESYDAVGGSLVDHPESPDELKRLRSTTRRKKLSELCGIPYAMGGNLATRKEVLEWLQGWDPQWAPAGEDVDLSWRAQLAGCTLGYAPEAAMAYRLRGTANQQLRQTYVYARTNARLERAYAGLLTKPPAWRDEMARLRDLIRSFPYRKPWRRRSDLRAWRMRATIARGRWRGMTDRNIPVVRVPGRLPQAAGE